MSHKHITLSQINEIAILKRTDMLQKDIAQIVGVSPSATSQEITRNKDTNGVYHARHAKEKRKAKRVVANQRFRKIANSI